MLAVARGASLSDVADELVISVNTAKTHARNLRVKLGAAHLANAVFLAFFVTSGSSEIPIWQDTDPGQHSG